MKRYFITGIDTNVGKTIASAVLVEALKADYWKPIQTGSVSGNDRTELENLITNTTSNIHKESYSFGAPVSPHLAAAIENKTIDLDNILLPTSTNNLIIEGAGGILVPLNKKEFVIDIAKKINAEVILVIRNYVGCINHSLLSIDYLVKNNYKIKGLILNGNFDELVEDAIASYVNIPVLAKFPEMKRVDKVKIWDLAQSLKIENFK